MSETIKMTVVVVVSAIIFWWALAAISIIIKPALKIIFGG